jgi:hypothetical protein
MPRFVVLEHTGHPDDAAGGRHFDLLLEDGGSCRTWKLSQLPGRGGDAVVARELPPHRLAWLEVEEADVSGDRGHARRVGAGQYRLIAADAPDLRSAVDLVLELDGAVLSGRLHCREFAEGWSLRLD